VDVVEIVVVEKAEPTVCRCPSISTRSAIAFDAVETPSNKTPRCTTPPTPKDPLDGVVIGCNSVILATEPKN
jgi:hypothetical protein